MKNEKENYNIVANYIVEKYIDRISGEDVQDYLIVESSESPEDRVMVGMLAANRVKKGYDGRYKENDDNKYQSIPAISVTFVMEPNSKGEIKVFPLGSLYYKVKHTY